MAQGMGAMPGMGMGMGMPMGMQGGMAPMQGMQGMAPMQGMQGMAPMAMVSKIFCCESFRTAERIKEITLVIRSRSMGWCPPSDGAASTGACTRQRMEHPHETSPQPKHPDL